MIQLDPPLPLMTPKGPALAHFIIDYGIETHLYWTVFLDNSGECWTFSNPEVRMAKNPTIGRSQISQIESVSNGHLKSHAKASNGI
jgi:hypothetical protein